MKRLANRAYLGIKTRLNYRIDRYLEWAYLLLSGYYEVRWKAARPWVKKLVYALGDVLLFLKYFPRLSVFRVCGPEWDFIYVGSEESPSPENRKELAHLVVGESVKIEAAGRVNAWDLQGRIAEWLESGVDLVVCELSRFQPVKVSAPLRFRVPIWVNQAFVILEPVDSLIRGKKAKALRLARRAMNAGYTSRFSQSEQEFDHFYHSMYVPYILHRHGDLATLSPYKDLHKWFEKGGLVLVEKDGQAKAGAVSYIADGTYISMAGGVLDADAELFRDGVHVYNTFAEANFASARGVRLYDMGPSLPLRSNGIFAHKALWGCRAGRRKRVFPEWIFLANRLTDEKRKYINDLGLIVEEKGCYYGLILLSEGETPSEDRKVEDHEEAVRDGLEGVIYLSARY